MSINWICAALCAVMVASATVLEIVNGDAGLAWLAALLLGWMAIEGGL